jgi:hypothetical protein
MVHFVTKASLYFWNLLKKTEFLIPGVTYFDRRKFSPQGLNQLIGKLWMDFSAQRRIFEHKLFYFGHNNIVLVRLFHILTIDGAQLTSSVTGTASNNSSGMLNDFYEGHAISSLTRFSTLGFFSLNCTPWSPDSWAKTGLNIDSNSRSYSKTIK